MTARNPIDLTEEEPITSLSSAEIEEGANVFLDLTAVLHSPQKWDDLQFIDDYDWRTFKSKVSRASATIIFFTTLPLNLFVKRNLYDLGIDNPVFFVKNKTTAIKALASDQPIVVIDRDVCIVQQLRKKFPEATAYWAMTQEKLTLWKVISQFIDLF